ncbi:MAG: hypothetical protein ACP5FK_02690 [bacterium]
MSGKFINYISSLFFMAILAAGFVSCSRNFSPLPGTKDSLWILPSAQNQQQVILIELEKAVLSYDTAIDLVANAGLTASAGRDEAIDSMWMESVRHFHLLLQLTVDNPAEINQLGISYANYLDALNYALYCEYKISQYVKEDSVELWSSRKDMVISYAQKELSKIKEIFPQLKNSLYVQDTEGSIQLNQTLYNEIQSRAKILEIIDSISILIYTSENYYSTCIVGPVNEGRPAKSFLLTYSYIYISSAYTNLLNSIEGWESWPGIDQQKFKLVLQDFSNFLTIYSQITNFYSENYYRSTPVILPSDLHRNYNQALNQLTFSQNELRKWVFEVN